MKPNKWVRLRDGRGGSLGLQYEAYYEIDRLRAELATMREKNETLQAVINAVAENLAQNEGKRLHITFQQMVYAYSTNVGGMEE